MKRAIRRQKAAKIKRSVKKEIDRINIFFDNSYKPNFVQKRIRQAYKNKGKNNNKSMTRLCHCPWCVDNLIFRFVREEYRINEEEADFVKLNYPPDWGYDWNDLLEETDEEREIRSYNLLDKNYNDYLDWLK
jgi:hypothetical protein